MNYTKEYWFINEDDFDRMSNIRIYSKCNTIATVNGFIKDTIQRDCNAQLIAAAPEMYEALKEAIKTIKALHGQDAWDIYNDHSPEMQKINKAINKAEGK